MKQALFALLVLSSPAWAQPLATTPDCPEVARAIQDLMRQDARLRDWPNLARYREANAELKRAGNRAAVVFMGDSITDNWDNDGYGGFFPGAGYVNRGIGGQTTPQMLVRLRPDVLAFKPQVLVVLAGTNDIAGNTGPMTNEEIQENLAAMAELATAHGTRVVLASVLPVSDYHAVAGQLPQTARRPPARIAALNDWMKKYAAEKGLIYLDYFTALADDRGMLKADLSADDLHPNVKGYTVMAPLAEAAITKAMK
jgi:lysophospholipase L1-like esterase